MQTEPRKVFRPQLAHYSTRTMPAVKNQKTVEKVVTRKEVSSLRWYLGMIQAAVFSLAYFVAPFYMITAIAALGCRYPTPLLSWIYAAPIFVSALLPPI